MKKIVVAVLSACVLLSLSPQLTAKIWEIEIKVEKDVEGIYYIDMGEKYAFAVPEKAVIKWKCDYPFSLQFENDAPFEPTAEKDADRIIDTDRIKGKKVMTRAIPNCIYKYTVSVTYGSGSPLLLDPVIIIIPPRK